MRSTSPVDSAKAATGITGLDQILDGGLPRNHIYLLEGDTGTGKTTLALQFALTGAAAGETVLYITLTETAQELKQIATSHGWSTDTLHIYEIRPADAVDASSAEQTIFRTSDVELSEVVQSIRAKLAEIKPDRAVFDSMTELHLMAENQLRYRRQLLSLRQALSEINCTALLINNQLFKDNQAIQSLVHGEVNLKQTITDYGNKQRWLSVKKMRGMRYHEGYHDFRILTGGLAVYPRLRVPDEDQPADWSLRSSGSEELDTLLGGGLNTGTSCLIAGQTGTGKSTLLTQYVYSSVQRGEATIAFVFDERRETFLKRAKGLGLDLEPYVEDGLLTLHQTKVEEILLGDFVRQIQKAVTEDEVKLVAIDSLSGFLNTMPPDRFLITQMHALLTYLNQKNVLSLLTLTHHGVVGNITAQDIDVSYLADTLILLRHFEAGGSVRQAISVIKKRHGTHEKSIRELSISDDGVEVGAPLVDFSGVLSGQPRYEGNAQRLISNEETDSDDW